MKKIMHLIKLNYKSSVFIILLITGMIFATPVAHDSTFVITEDDTLTASVPNAPDKILLKS